jgi:glycosyltransferase involved in cell wall biosynthesis
VKILFVTHNYLPHCLGGVEIYVDRLARLLQQRGHAVQVLYPRHGAGRRENIRFEEGACQGIPTVEVLTGLSSHDATWLVRNDILQPALKEFLTLHRPDVAHVHHLFGLSVSCLDVLEELRIPTILSLHDFWLPCFQMHLVAPEGRVCSGPDSVAKCTKCLMARFPNSAEKERALFGDFLEKRRQAHLQAIRMPGLVLYTSRFMGAIHQQYGFANRRMVHMPLGIPLFSTATAVTRQIPPVRFAYLGTVSHRKGLDLLIDAFRRLDPAKAELHIHGAISEQKLFDDAMRSLAPGSPVTYHGPYQAADLPRILTAVDVAVIPSRGEAYSLLAREVLHGRVPVIAANVGAIPEIVEDGRNGLLFQENNTGDLAEKLQRLIDEPSLIARLRDGIRPVRSIEEDVMALEAIYSDIAGQR